jgi:hypothetical protein
MKSTIKFAALGACALAASTTAALATSTLPAGVTTGIALGAPLPEGVYDITIGSYGTRDAVLGNLTYAIPVWLIWSTPWQIAGGRIVLDTATGVADVWTPGNIGGAGIGIDSWLNTLVEAQIKWNFGNGWNGGFQAGAWLPSTQTLPMILGRDYTAFQGAAMISYVANGWNLTASGFYGSGGDNEVGRHNWQPSWVNLDLTATKKLGKMEIGAIAYGSWDLDARGYVYCAVGSDTCKQSQFAVGGLVGYDFGAFITQFKLAADVAEENYGGREVRGNINIIKPLWNPAPLEAPLK